MNETGNSSVHASRLEALDVVTAHRDLVHRLRELADEVEDVVRAGETLESIEIAEMMQAEQAVKANVSHLEPVRATDDEHVPASGQPGSGDGAVWDLPWEQPEPPPWLDSAVPRAAAS